MRPLSIREAPDLGVRGVLPPALAVDHLAFDPKWILTIVRLGHRLQGRNSAEAL